MAKIIGRKIERYQSLGSTSDEAKRLVKEGEGEGLVVVAGEQTRGRGKPGSSWFSPPGGIYLSAVVKPFKNPDDLAPVTLLGAKAAVQTIRQATGLEAEIKPPNDVLLNEKKICGVLVERLASGHLIIGIGLNVNLSATSLPEIINSSATSLFMETGKEHDVPGLAASLLQELDKEYLAYLSGI